ncbi:MATE family efflux transporter [Oscillibacter sp.]|uniref:MATE family efflux transporter n=1 Tax=Oscillibacter sp. TaxID=1945593 RepID=UPI00260CFFFD|nr:MATE family efflux transporter [Oscillibacter sp.]MDD3346113.1 MATE family efflux transporter [Oscillibacter sp.]
MEQTAPGARNMTVGSPAGHIVAFALPLLAGSFLQQLYNMVDSWVVGRYVGDGALAAVGVGFPVIFMFTSLFMGLSNGGTVVIAQFFGAGRMDRVRDAVDTIYTTFLFSVIPVTVLAVAAVKPILLLLRVESGAYREAFVYLLVVCIGLTGTIGYNLNAGILSGLGNSRTTLLFLAISAVMNIVLDLVLVLVIPLGVLGVALGTIISQAFSWLFGIFYINRKYPAFSIRPFCRRFDRELFGQIMGIGLPAGIQMSLVALGAMVVMSKINSFGKEFAAGYNVGYRLDQLAFLPVQSLSTAVTAFVGQNIGAHRLDRARQGIHVTVLVSALWSLLMAAVLIPFGGALVGLFSPTPAVIHAGAVYLRCIMPFYALFAVMFCLNNAMRGAGESVFPMVNVLFSLILLRVPAVYWFADRFGPDYMYYGIGVGWVLGFTISLVYYLSGRWKRRGSLADQADPSA